MARIALDPDQGRLIVKNANQTAESIQDNMSQLVSEVLGVEWQSQPWAEKANNLEAMSKVNAKSIQAMRLMARAAQHKAARWEVISNKFNGQLNKSKL